MDNQPAMSLASGGVGNAQGGELDPKKLLLDLISKSHGPQSAMIADAAFKNQDKQIKEAMIDHGMKAEDVLKSSGIDINTLLGGKPNKRGNFLYTPFQVDQQTGTVTPASILGGLISQHPDDVMKMAQANSLLNGADRANQESLIRNRNLESDLMEKQLNSTNTDKVYRDPVTGQEVDQATAEEDMKNGLGIYQVNQRLSTRAGVIEKPLNKVPDLTQDEKKYVQDAQVIDKSLGTLKSGFSALYKKHGASNWQSLQIDKLPYFLSQDQDVQNLKSELTYLKAAIPFLRGGKSLTKEEGARIDIMLSPFGKNEDTYNKDIERFQNEFMVGQDIMKFGVNAGLMKKYIKGKSVIRNNNKNSSSGLDYDSFLKAIGG